MICGACGFDDSKENKITFLESDLLNQYKTAVIKGSSSMFSSVYVCPKCGTIRVSDEALLFLKNK